MNTPQEPQMHKHIVRQCYCPKCKCKDLILKEVWNGHYITFDYNEGMIVGKGNLEVGNPYKVEAFCNNCNHEWTLKGVTQIGDVAYNIA